jgi:tRNA threonylcarbamoyladenosine biosynthesis protein TsaE
MALITSRSPAETFALGQKHAASLRNGSVIALVGDLGAGKTHFVKGLAAGLGHAEEVTSPTFTLLHEYAGGRLPLYHFDFYRLDSEDEALRMGLDDYLEATGVCVVEWGDKFRSLLPRGTQWIELRAGPDDTREILFGEPGAPTQ